MNIAKDDLYSVHKLRLDRIEERVEKLSKNIEDMQDKISKNTMNNARFQEMFSSFDKRFEKVENGLNSVVVELKSISSSIADIRARSELGDERLQDKIDNSIKSHIAQNKELYAIITTLITLLSYVIKNWG